MDDAPQITITFGGREYTGRRLSPDQILTIRSVRDDTDLMLDLMETLAEYAFGRSGFSEHLLARARGEATVEGFIKLMLKFMEASSEHFSEEQKAAEAPPLPMPEHRTVPATFRGLDVDPGALRGEV